MPTVSPDTTVDQSEAAQLLELTTVLTRDAQDRITRWTAGCERLYGFTREGSPRLATAMLCSAPSSPRPWKISARLSGKPAAGKARSPTSPKMAKPSPSSPNGSCTKTPRAAHPLSWRTTRTSRTAKPPKPASSVFTRLTSSGSSIWNLDGGVLDANDKFLEMVGYTRDDLRAGRLDWVRMTPPEYWPLDEHARDQIRHSRQTRSFRKGIHPQGRFPRHHRLRRRRLG